MERRQSGFAQLMLACAGVVKEIRLTIEEQQERAKKREQGLRTENRVLAHLVETAERKEEVGITLHYVQQKVREAIQRRDALRIEAEKFAPIYTGYIAIVFRDMEECLQALLLIQAQTKSLREHIVKHIQAPNLEQKLKALIADLAPDTKL